MSSWPLHFFSLPLNTHTLTPTQLYSHGFLVLAPDPMVSAFPFSGLIFVTWKAGSRVTAQIKKKKKKPAQEKSAILHCDWACPPPCLPPALPPSAQWCAAGTQGEPLRRRQRRRRRQRSWKPAAAPSLSSIECAKRQFCILKKPIERPLAFPARLKLAFIFFFSVVSSPTPHYPPLLQLQQKEGRGRERKNP